MVKLLRIAAIAHKYEFSDTDTWALGEALACMKALPSLLGDHVLLKRLLTVGAMVAEYGHAVFRDLETLAVSALIENHATPMSLLTIVESLGFKRATGLAYHEILTGSPNWSTNAELSTSQRINLFVGYHHHTEFLDTLTISYREHGCTDTNCRATWRRLCDGTLRKARREFRYDIHAVAVEIKRDGKRQLSKQCNVALGLAVDAVWIKFVEELPTYFELPFIDLETQSERVERGDN